MLPSVSLTQLRERANGCLATAAPSPEDAHALAVLALDVVAKLQTPAAHPYRALLPSPSAPEADVAALVALERALEDCQARLRLATAEIAALRARAP